MVWIKFLKLIYCINCGGMAEWLKAAVLKTASRVIVTGVRIPLPPPVQHAIPSHGLE